MERGRPKGIVTIVISICNAGMPVFPICNQQLKFTSFRFRGLRYHSFVKAGFKVHLPVMTHSRCQVFSAVIIVRKSKIACHITPVRCVQACPLMRQSKHVQRCFGVKSDSIPGVNSPRLPSPQQPTHPGYPASPRKHPMFEWSRERHVLLLHQTHGASTTSLLSTPLAVSWR